jgi:hypothetical protein
MTKIFKRVLRIVALAAAAAFVLAAPARAAAPAQALAPAQAAGLAPAEAADPANGFGDILETAGFAGQEAYGALGSAQQVARQGAESTKIAQSGVDKAFAFGRFLMGS